MIKKNSLKKSVVLACLSMFFGCTGDGKTSAYPTVNSLSQERLYLREKPFVLSETKPSIPFPPKAKTRGIGTASVVKALIGTIASEFINTTVDIVGKSIVSLSGKDNKTTTIESEISNFFYKGSTYNLASHERNPSFNLLFISGEFGEEAEFWTPKGLDSTQADVFKTLHLVGKPNFYMEAKIFPVPGNKYMEIVPTYMFYNRPFNSKGLDSKRDLNLHFSFFDLEDTLDRNLISEGNVILKDVKVGREYTAHELAGVRTTFIKMPSISEKKKAYSGGYHLKVRVTETRDINEWLATLGEIISTSKDDISSKLYVTDEQKIERETSLAKAQIEVKIMEVQLEEARLRGDSKIDILELESQLLDKKLELNKEALR